MGLLFSCCRRRERHSSEREPLLPKHRVARAADRIRPSQAQINKLADVIAALKSGKLPSQEQITQTLYRIVHSDFLDDSQYQHVYGPLSDGGKEVLQDIREVLQAVMQFNDENNGDSIIQDLFFQYSKIQDHDVPVHVDVEVDASASERPVIDTIVNEIPSTGELHDDAATLLRSLRTLTRVLLTSSAFRALLTDLVSVARDVLGDTAAKVGRVAESVQGVARTVEDIAQNVEVATRAEGTQVDFKPTPTTRGTCGPVIQDGQSGTSASWDIVSNGDPEGLKATAIERLQEAMREAQKDPASRRALSAILTLLRDYSLKLKTMNSALADVPPPGLTPVVWAEPLVAECLSDLRLLISRMASGRPLEPLIHAMSVSMGDLAKLPAEIVFSSGSSRKLQNFLADLNDWFDTSLSDTRYAISPEGKSELEDLYDRAHALIDEGLRSEAEWLHHLRTLLSEADTLLAALRTDGTTNRLLNAVSALSSSLSSLTQTAVARTPSMLDASQKKIRADIRRDVIRWLLPRVLGALRVIPMPRVEYTSTNPDLDVVVDALYLTPSSAQASLIPDHIRVCNFSEIRLDVIEVDHTSSTLPTIPSVQSDGMRTFTRLHVYVDGVRLSARDVGYYVSWHAFHSKWLRWLGYEDEGLVGLDVGGRGVHGDGLGFDFEIEYASDSTSDASDGLDTTEVDTLFKVSHVNVTLRGLRLHLDDSRHWILNKLLLQPLAGPVGRFVAGWALEKQLRALLETFGRVGAQIENEVRGIAQDQDEELEWIDYTSALWRVLVGDDTQALADEASEEVTEETPLIDSSTRVTTKGVVRETRTTYPMESSSLSPRGRNIVDESVLAVGIGAQILPGRGGPCSDAPEEHGYGPRDMAREGLDEVQSRLDQATEAGHEAIRHGTEIRRDAENAGRREQVHERAERRSGGWRSGAFDL